MGECVKLTFEQYEVRNQRWRSASVRYREVKREYCCEELSQAQEDYKILLIEKRGPQLFLYFESDGGYSVSLLMQYCLFCGAEVKYEVNVNGRDKK